MDPDTSDPAPTHVRLGGQEELREALGRVTECARRQLRIFDYDLADGGYNSPARFEQLRAFLLASRSNRIDIIVRDTGYLMRDCPRLLMLLRQFSHALRINQTVGETRSISDSFVLADTRHYVHRFHYESPRALLALDDVPGALALNERFDEIWQSSTPAVFSTTLGL